MLRKIAVAALVGASFASVSEAQNCAGASADWTGGSYDTACLAFDTCEKVRAGQYGDFNKATSTDNASDVADALAQCGGNPNAIAQALRALGNAVGGAAGAAIIQQADNTATTGGAADTTGRNNACASCN